MLATAYKGRQGLPEEEATEFYSSQSVDHQLSKNAFSTQSSILKSKSAMFLATQMMFEIGSTLGQKVAAGEISENEMYGAAAKYLGKFPSDLANMDPVHLLTCPDQVASLLQPETRQQLQNLIKSNSFNGHTDNSECSLDQVEFNRNASSTNELKDARYKDELLEKAMGDAGTVIQQEYIGLPPDLAAAEKGEPINIKEEQVDVSARMIYDEGTDVDTGVTERTFIPPSFVFEINEAFNPRKQKKQPEKKSSWWKVGAAVGLVGLTGVGIYKYLSN